MQAKYNICNTRRAPAPAPAGPPTCGWQAVTDDVQRRRPPPSARAQMSARQEHTLGRYLRLAGGQLGRLRRLLPISTRISAGAQGPGLSYYMVDSQTTSRSRSHCTIYTAQRPRYPSVECRGLFAAHDAAAPTDWWTKGPHSGRSARSSSPCCPALLIRHSSDRGASRRGLDGSNCDQRRPAGGIAGRRSALAERGQADRARCRTDSTEQGSGAPWPLPCGLEGLPPPSQVPPQARVLNGAPKMVRARKPDAVRARGVPAAAAGSPVPAAGRGSVRAAPHSRVPPAACRKQARPGTRSALAAWCRVALLVASPPASAIRQPAVGGLEQLECRQAG